MSLVVRVELQGQVDREGGFGCAAREPDVDGAGEPVREAEDLRFVVAEAGEVVGTDLEPAVGGISPSLVGQRLQDEVLLGDGPGRRPVEQLGENCWRGVGRRGAW
ncbi:hypothetical protein UQW22_18490 [Isoptericola halotolerans]|uniref:hypothetical protein n=1 Tax=Isoptericola halotolerans TaxID=300560 RepID=UPI003890AE64